MSLHRIYTHPMSAGAPAWVSITALGVAGFAALVALGSAWISFLAYRATGPRILLRTAHISNDPGRQRVIVEFTVVNRGRGEVNVSEFLLTPAGTRKTLLTVGHIEGKQLPFRLVGGAEQSWQANILPVARAYHEGLQRRTYKPKSSWPTHFYFSVRTGDGKIARAREQQFDAPSVIAAVVARTADPVEDDD
ncbi:hypothetical protein DLJ61_17950 [Gordonia terrae]|uniref:Uncharacterized protein n=3 Tax=Gordonia terrae TaxID=2055 RepID=A0AAD0K8A5_9ACTN|nr:hypothetical protein BCM27_17760 [Gordonia terrae]AWO85143.1 hypothetical protein DLJ61_17950 [Gordonia terrae]GAB46774.1 hypothetical protein GOTRE_181_00540 [Gordonia terrae NBRC 100016]